jgi:hypothetical protein
MLIACASVGDALITLVAVTPITPDLNKQMRDRTYNLSFTDLPTDRTYTHSIVGENNALHAFAAWIAADDGPGFPTIQRMLDELRNSPARKHLP